MVKKLKEQAAKLNVYIRLARLHRPIGIWLLLFPSWWGIALASPQWPSFKFLILFGCGAVIMRSAGCIYNDIIDKDFDKKVRRTASRPLASGELSIKESLFFLLTLLTTAALILLSLPLPAILVGFIALSLVLFYPWMKRFTYWPQLFLGITFNIGIFLGWLCLQPTLSLIPALFYGGAIFWTIGYDTIYAFQDREDDLLAGIKSSALVVSTTPKLFLSLVYSAALILWVMGGIKAELIWIYWVLLSFIAMHLAWQVLSLKEDIPANCLKRFVSNTSIGILLFLAIVFSRLID